MNRLALALTLSTSLLWPAAGLADVGAARALFDRGIAALQQGRFPHARDLFLESLEHHPNPATAFNLVLALRGAEQPTGALEQCAALLDARYGRLTRSRAQQVRHVCDQIETEVARLSIGIDGAPRAQLRIDGVPAGEVEAGSRMDRELDPGRHVVTATASAHAAAERSVEVARGETVQLTLSLVELAGPSGALENAAPSGPDWGVIVAAVGGAVGAIAVAVIIGFAVAGSEPLPPTTNELFPEPLPTFAP